MLLIDEILSIKQYFVDHKVKCIKYNYGLEHITQNFSAFQAYIQLSPDENRLIITNRKPIEKVQYDNDAPLPAYQHNCHEKEGFKNNGADDINATNSDDSFD